MSFSRAAKTAPAVGYLREDRCGKDEQVPLQALLWGRDCRTPRPSSATCHREQAFGHRREHRVQAQSEDCGVQDEWEKCLGTMRDLLSRMDSENRASRQKNLPRGIDMEIFSAGPRRPVRASHTVCSGPPRSASFDGRQESRPSSRGSVACGASVADEVKCTEAQPPCVDAPAALRAERPASAASRASSASACSDRGACCSGHSGSTASTVRPRRPTSARKNCQGRPVPFQRLPSSGRPPSVRRHTTGSNPVAAAPLGGSQDGSLLERNGGQDAAVRFTPTSRASSPGGPRAPSPRRVSTPCVSTPM